MRESWYPTIICGTAFHATVWGEIEVLENCLFCIREDGVIAERLLPGSERYDQMKAQYTGQPNYHELKEGQYLLPGFVDLHIHAPQWANMGKALHVPLEVWLQQYTFPLESEIGKLDRADLSYHEIVSTTLAQGTTTAVYLGTQDKESTLWLGAVCGKLGQRGYIGKVVMDNPDECPSFYRDQSTQQALYDTEDFIIRLQKRSEDTVQGLIPVLTPRFTPSCSDEALQGLGDLAKRYHIPVQTHVSESNWEAGYARSRFGKSDTAALASFGLLTDKTVLAHGTLLTDEDAELLAAHGSTVAHCPISNAFFGNAVYPVRKRYAQGVNAGLGTDVSGGFSPSMYDNIRQAVIVSRMLEDGVNAELPPQERGVPDSRIDYRHAFYMATTAGGKALGLPVGLFSEGYVFDAQLIDVNTPFSTIRLHREWDSPEDCLQKILFLANSANIIALWIQGKEVLRKLRRYYVGTAE